MSESIQAANDDETRDTTDERPSECECGALTGLVPCWACFEADHRTAAVAADDDDDDAVDVEQSDMATLPDFDDALEDAIDADDDDDTPETCRVDGCRNTFCPDDGLCVTCDEEDLESDDSDDSGRLMTDGGRTADRVVDPALERRQDALDEHGDEMTVREAAEGAEILEDIKSREQAWEAADE